MVILETTTDETTSDGAETTSDGTGSLDHDQTNTADETDGGLVNRLVSMATDAAALIEPFAALLTAVVNAATVYTLVRKA